MTEKVKDKQIKQRNCFERGQSEYISTTISKQLAMEAKKKSKKEGRTVASVYTRWMEKGAYVESLPQNLS